MALNEDKLMQFLNRFVGDLGATIAAGNVVVGHRLGLYRALADAPGTSDDLARRTDCDPRYIAEWLRGQAAGGYVDYDATTDTYALTEEQAFVLADPDGAMYAPGAFVLALGSLRAEERVAEAFRTGAGIGWHEHDEGVFVGCEQFFRPGYLANLVSSWIPALDGVEEKLRDGARVADVGCGLGASTLLMAQSFANSTFTGTDYHDGSIELARKRAAETGLGHRVSFEVASAQTYSRHRLRPGDHVRLPARHGRPGRRRDPHPPVPGRRRHLAHRRTVRRQRGRGQPQPGRSRVLQLLDVPVRAERAVPARRVLPRGPGR